MAEPAHRTLWSANNHMATVEQSSLLDTGYTLTVCPFDSRLHSSYQVVLLPFLRVKS